MNKVEVSFSYDSEKDRLESEEEGSAMDIALASAVHLRMIIDRALLQNKMQGILLREIIFKILKMKLPERYKQSVISVDLEDFGRMIGRGGEGNNA